MEKLIKKINSFIENKEYNFHLQGAEVVDALDLPFNKGYLPAISFYRDEINRDLPIKHDAKPFLAQYVKEPIRFINFKIELYHASDLYACEAKITRKPIDKPNANEQHIASVKFDYPTKSFTYTIIEPEAGFVYKINWEKPSL